MAISNFVIVPKMGRSLRAQDDPRFSSTLMNLLVVPHLAPNPIRAPSKSLKRASSKISPPLSSSPDPCLSPF